VKRLRGHLSPCRAVTFVVFLAQSAVCRAVGALTPDTLIVLSHGLATPVLHAPWHVAGALGRWAVVVSHSTAAKNRRTIPPRTAPLAIALFSRTH
jgi:hypothetical protein